MLKQYLERLLYLSNIKAMHNLSHLFIDDFFQNWESNR